MDNSKEKISFEICAFRRSSGPRCSSLPSMGPLVKWKRDLVISASGVNVTLLRSQLHIETLGRAVYPDAHLVMIFMIFQSCCSSEGWAHGLGWIWSCDIMSRLGRCCSCKRTSMPNTPPSWNSTEIHFRSVIMNIKWILFVA